MADPYGHEEEQLRAIKQWWDSNGASTLIGLGLAIAIVFGWQWWQQRQRDLAASASMLYQQLEQATTLAESNAAQRATAEHLAATLEAEHGSTLYNYYGQLLLARMLVEADDLNAAESVLRELQSRELPAQVAELVRLRLAQVQFAAGRLDEALASLAAAPADTFAYQYAELRGDLYLSRDQQERALQAYREALQLAQSNALVGSGLLRIKLESLEAGSLASAPEAASPSSSEDGVEAAPQDAAEADNADEAAAEAEAAEQSQDGVQ